MNFYNLEAEKAVLGSILLDNSCMAKVMHMLDGSEFSDARHKAIWDTMVGMTLGGKPIDYLTLQHDAALAGRAHIIAPEYISILTDEVPTPSNVDHYARVIKQLAVSREVDLVLREGTEKIQNGHRPEDIVALAQDIADRGAAALEVRDVKGDLEETARYLKAVQSGEQAALIDTGFCELQQYAPGTDELMVIAARPSTGKTALALWMAETIAKSGNVLFCSIEMSRRNLNFRRWAAFGDIRLDKFRTKGGLDEDDLERLDRAKKEAEESKVIILDHAVSLGQIVTEAKRYHSKGNLRAVIIDHLLLMKIPQNDRRDLQLGFATGVLKRMATRMGITIILLTQLSRKSESEKREDNRPFLSDLRDSGVIEQDLDVCWLQHRPDRHSVIQKPEMLVMCAKNRNGPVGEAVIGYSPATGRFWDSDPGGNYGA